MASLCNDFTFRYVAMALYIFFRKNQILLAEAHCSYLFSGFQVHLFLFCSCDNYQPAKRGKRLENG